MWTILLLTASNVFMTFAWYGHLKWFKGDSHAIWIIILISWAIALLEYCFMVPANRLGKDFYRFDFAQLKTMQEIITLVVFAGFSIWFLNFKLGWNHLAAFACIVAAGFFVFYDFAGATKKPVDETKLAAYSAADTGKE
jgi:uncharacterized protein (DUF486 family)